MSEPFTAAHLETLTALVSWLKSKLPGVDVDAECEAIAAALAEIDRLRRERAAMADAAEMLWIVLANVSGGDWTQQSVEWQEAAARWRDAYFTVAHPPSKSRGEQKKV